MVPTNHGLTAQVWLADIRPLAGREERGMALLPPGRRRTARAIVQPEDRLHSIAAGLLLRRVLGVVSDDVLETNEYGKPALKEGPGFSLSHGGNYAALAVFPGDVGIDIEPLRSPPHLVPRRFFTREEQQWYRLAPSEERFCRLWTRLESALKADGRGLALEARDFSVVESGAPWYLETLQHDGHILSCAARVPFSVRLTLADPEELLTDHQDSGNRLVNISL